MNEGSNIDAAALTASITGENPIVKESPAPVIPSTPQPEDFGESTEVEIIEGLAPPPQEIHVTDPKPQKQVDVFKNLIPSTDRMMVFKVDTKGHKGYIGDYSSADLDRSQGIEMFIRDYVVPTWGAGDFIVEIRDVKGKVKRQGLVPIPAPVQSQKQEAVSLQDLLVAQKTMQQEADKKAAEQVNQMTTMFGFLKEMMPKGKEASGDGGSSMMMLPMMMMFMQQQNRPSGPDPMTMMLLQKLSAQADQPQMPPPIPLPFPPALPPPDPTASASSTADLIKAVIDAVKSAQPQQQNNDLLTTVIAKVLQPDKNQITTKDLVDMLPTLRDLAGGKQEGATTFNDYLEGLMRLDELRGGGGDDTSIWAGLAEMVTGVFRDIKMQQMKLEMLQKTGQLRKAQAQRMLPKNQAQPQQPQQQVERRVKVPAIPVSFRRYAIRMNSAFKKGDESALIMAFMEGLLHLRENSDEWAPYVEEMMMSAGSGDKARALRFIEVFLFSFAKRKLISSEVVGVTKKLIAINWDAIIEETGMVRAMQEEIEGQEPEEPEAEPEAEPELEEGLDEEFGSSSEEAGEEAIDPSELTPEQQAELAAPPAAELPETPATNDKEPAEKQGMVATEPEGAENASE